MTEHHQLLRVLLRFEIEPGQEQEFEKTWLSVAAGIAAQPANLAQSLHRGVDEASTYYVLTDWRDRDSFTAFETSAAHQENLRRLRPFRRGGWMHTMNVAYTLDPR